MDQKAAAEESQGDKFARGHHPRGEAISVFTRSLRGPNRAGRRLGGCGVSRLWSSPSWPRISLAAHKILLGALVGETHDWRRFRPVGTVAPSGPQRLHRLRTGLHLQQLFGTWSLSGGCGPFDTRPPLGSLRFLILHSHGSEAYTPPPGTDIVWVRQLPHYGLPLQRGGVGDEMAEVFHRRRDLRPHDRTLYDHSSGTIRSDYYDALAAIESYLAQYPSLRFILDVHRDAIGDAGAISTKVISEIDGWAPPPR